MKWRELRGNNMSQILMKTSALVLVGILASCGGKEVSSDAEFDEVAMTVEPGTVTMALAGDDDEGLGLISLNKVKFAYSIKGCRSGFEKIVKVDPTTKFPVEAEWIAANAKHKIKLYKGDQNCRAELVGLEVNSQKFVKIFTSNNTEVSLGFESKSGIKASSTIATGTTSKTYFLYKPASVDNNKSIVLKVPEAEPLSTKGIKFVFESVRNDIATKAVSDVSSSQGVSIGALEAPNMTIANTGAFSDFGLIFDSASGSSKQGFKVDAIFTCEDGATASVAGKINGTGTAAACKTPGGDNQKLSNMSAVLVSGRTNTNPLSYDEAEAKFKAADEFLGTTAALKTAVTAEASGTKVKFNDVKYWANAAPGNGQMLAWLIVRMSESSGGQTFNSYSVFNVAVDTVP